MATTGTTQPSASDKLGWTSIACACACAPGVVFFLMPTTAFLSNQAEFEFDLGLLWPYWLTTLVSAAVTVALARFLPKRSALLLARASFALGVYLALSDLLGPVPLRELRAPGHLSSVLWPSFGQVLVELVLSLACLAMLWIPARVLAALAPPVVGALYLSQLALFGLHLRPEAYWNLLPASQRVEQTQGAESLPNVYHITLDMFSGTSFMLHEETLQPSDFEGFTVFPENRSNYLYTYVSVASYMTGQLYTGGRMRDFLSEWHADEGLLAEAHRAGYAIRQYVPGPGWRSRHAAETYFPPERRLQLQLELADIVLLRLVPSYAHPFAYRSRGYWGFTGLATQVFQRVGTVPTVNTLPSWSTQLFERMLQEEERRPRRGQYVYAHIYLPHWPFVMGADGSFQGEKATWVTQQLCAINLMRKLTKTLKSQGKYRDSVVVFHSDHGDAGFYPLPDALRMDPTTRAKFDEVDRAGFGESVEIQSRALLLVKPSKSASAPLQISTRRTQLLDLAPTIRALTGLPAREDQQGTSVFAPEFPDSRRLHVFSGFSQNDEKGQQISFGHGLTEGFMNHYTNGPEGWRILDDLPTSW